MINIKTNSIDLILINNKENNNVNKELYRVLKPGAYLFSIDKPHKSHNTVCDIEDIRFEIKDSISYFFAENEEVKQDVICLAMKPLSEKNFAENVMKWGTGGLNIDGTRIPTTEIITTHSNGKRSMYGGCSLFESKTHTTGQQSKGQEIGRYPANFIISEDIAPVLDKQSGYSKSSDAIRRNNQSKHTGSKNGAYCYGKFNDCDTRGYSDAGGASRFFYNAKSYKDLLRYITVLGLPPNESKVLFIGFDNVDEIIEEINKESNVKYEAATIGGIE